MFKNYIKIAFRKLINEKVYSFINLVGLSISIAFSVLVFLFVQSEYSYDKHYDDSDKIYRVCTTKNHPERGVLTHATTPNPLRDVLRENFQQIAAATRMVENTAIIIKIGTNSFVDNVLFADEDFFNIFSQEIISGNKSSAFNDFSSAVITDQVAQKYFGNENPIGKTIKMEIGKEEYSFIISSVINPSPKNSSYNPRIIIPYMWLKKALPSDWAWNFNTNIPELYVKLDKDVDAKSFGEALQSVRSHFADETINEADISLTLQPIADIHFSDEFGDGNIQVSDEKYVFILMGLALLILLVACINFTTLSIGRSIKRAKEVGVRKVLGAFKKQLIIQYLSETFLTGALSIVLGLFMAAMLLPLFNQLSGKELEFTLGISSGIALIGICFIIAVISGFYPAFILSGYQPTKVLKGSIKLKGKNIFSRALVITQFAFSIFLLIATLVISNQLSFISERNLGFDKDRVIEVSLNSPNNILKSYNKFNKVSDAYSNNSNILSVTAAFNEFGQKWTKLTTFDPARNSYSFYVNIVDVNYINTLDIKLISGRNFSNEHGTDFRQAVIVNKAFVDYMEWNDPLSAKLPGKFQREHNIIGVIENFNFSSLHNKVEPLAIGLSFSPFGGEVNLSSENWPPLLNYAMIKVPPGETVKILDNIKSVWAKTTENEPFLFKFLDERIQTQYENEMKISSIINYASLFAILIAALGLFGLATISAENRFKEIGIRKVLGSSISSIVFLISKELMLLVALANIIAWPIAFFILNNWLQNFEYKVDLNILQFVFAGAAALLTAFITISYHAVKAARVNPVKSLQYE